jgi:hypothetical protein
MHCFQDGFPEVGALDLDVLGYGLHFSERDAAHEYQIA